MAEEDVPQGAGSSLIGPFVSRSPAASIALSTSERLQELADQAAQSARDGTTTWKTVTALAGLLSTIAQTLIAAERQFAPLQSLQTRGPTLEQLAEGL